METWRHRSSWLAPGITVAIILVACGNSKPRSTTTDASDGCTEGRTVSCACSGGATGRQRCLSNGTWSSCRCGGDVSMTDALSPPDVEDTGGMVERDATDTDVDRPCPPEGKFPVPEDAIDITEHGASPNPNDPSLQAATTNTKALWRAAEKAGEGGAIYVPPGTFHIGQEERSTNVAFGGQEPTGISIYGAGPKQSVLALTEHMDPNDQSHVMFKYRNGADHGTVVYAHIQFDGNADQLGDLLGGSQRRAGRAHHLGDDVETLKMYNVYAYNWYSTAFKNGDGEVHVKWSTFENIGIAAKNDGGSGHAIGSMNGGGTIENSEFRRIGSFAVNMRYNDGTTIVKNSYMKGLGTGALKFSAGERFEAHNTYIEPHTKWMDENIKPNENGNDFNGWHFVNQIKNRNDNRGTIRFVESELRDAMRSGFKLRKKIEWEGRKTALYNANIEGAHGGAVSVEGEDAHLEADVESVSIHNSSGKAIRVRGDAKGARGTVKTLKRNGNSGGLGNLDGLSVAQDRSGANPYKPDVPKPSEVGIECTSPPSATP